MIGVSVYFQDLNYDYLTEAVKVGVTHAFTSVQVIEEDYSDIGEKLKGLMEFSKKNNLMLIPDISTRIYDKLGITHVRELKNMGFLAVRVDGDFDTVSEMMELTELFNVYLNASDIKVEFLQELKDAGCDMNRISLMHNFYPRVFTGLEKEHMVKINNSLKGFGIRMAAFVQGDTKLRGPAFEGLPTLEKHRGVNPYVATVELMNSCVDDVFIGDNEASIETLKLMSEYDKTRVIALNVHLYEEYKHLSTLQTPIRRDITDNIIRLAYGRKEINNVVQKNTVTRYKGAITMDNNLSGRYVGEINLCKNSIPSDGKVNVIGHVNPEMLELFKYINRDTVVRFFA